MTIISIQHMVHHLSHSFLFVSGFGCVKLNPSKTNVCYIQTTMSLWIVIAQAEGYSHHYTVQVIGAYRSKPRAVDVVVAANKAYYDECVTNGDLRRIRDVYFPDHDEPPSWEMCELLI